MLVLTRRVGEEIVIDGNIRVVVVAVQGERVRLGITAPPFVAVDRAEIHARRLAQTDPSAPKERSGVAAGAMMECVPKLEREVVS